MPKKATPDKKTVKGEEKTQLPLKKKERYAQAKGGRKTATALARVYASGKGVIVNDKDYKEYFKDERNQKKVIAPFEKLSLSDSMKATVKVSGSGINAQADAVRNAISRALVKQSEDFRGTLKPFGFLTRDGRMVERKKYGLKKARRAPQWSKR
jgi:small subunit ribosomal protein S9